jgi:hypothetical protein
LLLVACLSDWLCNHPVPPTPLPDAQVAALANEVNGETANAISRVVQFHRQRGSRGFHSAAELVAERAKAYGLSDVEILHFPPTERSSTDATLAHGMGRRQGAS